MSVISRCQTVSGQHTLQYTMFPEKAQSLFQERASIGQNLNLKRQSPEFIKEIFWILSEFLSYANMKGNVDGAVTDAAFCQCQYLPEPQSMALPQDPAKRME